MNSYKRLFIISAILVAVSGCTINKMSNKEILQTKVITLSQHEIRVELPVTQREQGLGLGGRTNLSDDEGMLFEFIGERVPAFWMKGMLIPIDIIWINQGYIIGINSNVPPDDGKRLYSPPSSASSVLEVAAGWTSRHRTVIGDHIE